MEHNIPSDCPICGNKLSISKLTCPKCNTEISGKFTPCKFALWMINAAFSGGFFKEPGNIKEVERFYRYPIRLLKDCLMSFCIAFGEEEEKNP
jgi:hypothetical protein